MAVDLSNHPQPIDPNDPVFRPMRAYVRRAFAPLGDERLAADLPALLRAAADMLSKE